MDCGATVNLNWISRDLFTMSLTYSNMPYSSTSLQVTPLLHNKTINELWCNTDCSNKLHFCFPTGGILPRGSPADRLTLRRSCINSCYLPGQGEIKFTFILNANWKWMFADCVFSQLFDDVMMNVLQIRCRPLQIIWCFHWGMPCISDPNI